MLIVGDAGAIVGEGGFRISRQSFVSVCIQVTRQCKTIQVSKPNQNCSRVISIFTN